MPNRRAQRRAAFTYNTVPLPTNEMNTSRYLDLAKRIKAGERVSDDDMYFVMKYTLGAADENKLQDLVRRQNEGIKDPTKRLSSEDVTTLIEETKKKLTSPEYKQQMLTALQKAETEDATGKLKTAMEIAISSTNFAVGAKQLQAFNKLAKESVKPAAPGMPAETPDYQAARRAVQQAVYQPSIAQKAAEAESKAIYQSELQNAKTAAGGQAGAYGALAQTAATRRGRRAAELAPQIAQIEAANRSNLVNFGTNAQQLAQQQYGNAVNQYNTQMQNYQAQQQALGQLRSAGEQNMLGAVTGALGQVPDIVGDRRIQQKYNTLRNQLTGMNINPSDIDRFSNVYSSIGQRQAAQQLAPGYFTDVNRIPPFNQRPDNLANFGYNPSQLPEFKKEPIY